MEIGLRVTFFEILLPWCFYPNPEFPFDLLEKNMLSLFSFASELPRLNSPFSFSLVMVALNFLCFLKSEFFGVVSN